MKVEGKSEKKSRKPDLTTYTFGKLGPLRFFVNLREWVQYIQNVVQYFFNAVEVKCALYLARPLVLFLCCHSIEPLET